MTILRKNWPSGGVQVSLTSPQPDAARTAVASGGGTPWPESGMAWSGPALFTNVSVPTRLPECTGPKATVAMHELLGAMAASVQLWPVSLNDLTLRPPSTTELMRRSAWPVLVMVTFREVLRWPSVTLPNARLVGLAWIPGTSTVPVIVTCCGLSGASSRNETVPCTLPLAVGRNRICAEHDWPGFNVALPQSPLAVVNSALPLRVACCTFIGAWPTF